MESIHAAFKLAAANAQESDAVPVVLVHVGLDFEHKTGEIFGAGVHQFAGQGILAGQRGGGQAQKLFQEGLHAEVGQRRAEEHRRKFAVVHGLQVKFLRRTVQQFNVVGQLLVVFGADEGVQRGIAQLGLDLFHHFHAVGASVALKGQHPAGTPVKHAFEALAAADGPIHGVGLDAQNLLDVLHQFKGVPGFPVHLVDEGEDGDVAQRADLEQFDGLGLHALGSIDDHDGGVRRHQGAVSVLTEILVAGGVQDVDALALVVELQHRGRDRDAALLFDVHPVGHRVLGALFAFDRAGGLDGAPVQQQFFRQRGFTGVRVRDDRKGTPAFDLFAQ